MTRVAVIGAGSWGTAVSALVAQNADEVVLWSHGSEGAKAINETHRNPRYLTDVELPANITATRTCPPRQRVQTPWCSPRPPRI